MDWSRTGRVVTAVLAMSAAVPVAGCGATATPEAVAGRSAPAAKPAVRATSGEVTMPDLSFAPSTVTAPAGRPVTWRNTSQVTHNVKGNGFFSRVIEPGATYRHAFAKPGRYVYVCTFHPGMRGLVVVR